MPNSPSTSTGVGCAGMALVAVALYLLGVGYVLHLIAGFVWPGWPLETWQTIAATFGIWLVGGLLFNGARS